ncbi:hypothetical protein FSP39_018729 [Pinctada imbricata]|uniref:Uridylate-specific endoribonuclease n=1 Tax=Pinctada imbricata TaxID=66713 RepID=A0AA88XMY6_PINIB|nr:hypothetical protein FSP39_018729 [Pinctada imbricata]
MTKLWYDDVNYATSRELLYNIQSHADTKSSSDHASNRLFSHLDESHLFSRPTYSTLLALLNNYYRNLGTPEHQTYTEDAEVSSFLTEISKSQIMVEAHKFLYSKGLASSSMTSFVRQLKTIWFTLYSRSSHSGSSRDTCAFEHVFVGETTNSKVDGFHSWIQFYLQEKAGHLNYLGYVFTRRPSVVAVHFSWYSKIKNVSTFIMGTSPEFDMAMLTTCFLARPNSLCQFSIDGQDVQIKTYDVPHERQRLIATAYVYN